MRRFNKLIHFVVCFTMRVFFISLQILIFLSSKWAENRWAELCQAQYLTQSTTPIINSTKIIFSDKFEHFFLCIGRKFSNILNINHIRENVLKIGSTATPNPKMYFILFLLFYLSNLVFNVLAWNQLLLITYHDYSFELLSYFLYLLDICKYLSFKEFYAFFLSINSKKRRNQHLVFTAFGN